jgi:hypothetical protein
MYRKYHNGQLSIKHFYMPFCGTLDPRTRWVLLAELIPWKSWKRLMLLSSVQM